MTDAAPAAQFTNVTFAYQRGKPVVRRITLGAEAGRITMLVGASGGGKTTLLKLLKGYLRPTQGEVTVFGRRVRAAPARGRLDPDVAYIPQQLGLVRARSALENTLTGALARAGTVRGLFRLFPSETVDQAWDTLARLGIGHKAHDPVYRLSGGERQRVAIARALMQRPRIILADEFLSQLDRNTTRSIMEFMQRLAADGITLLISAHDLELVTQYADRVIALRQGEIVLDAPRSGLTTDSLAEVIAP